MIIMATAEITITVEGIITMCEGQMKETGITMTTVVSEGMMIMAEENRSRIMAPVSKDSPVQIIMAARARITEEFIVRRNAGNSRTITGIIITGLNAVAMKEIMAQRQTESFGLMKTGHSRSNSGWKEDTNNHGRNKSNKESSAAMSNHSRREGSKNNLPASLNEEMIMADLQAVEMVAAMVVEEETEGGLEETNIN